MSLHHDFIYMLLINHLDKLSKKNPAIKTSVSAEMLERVYRKSIKHMNDDNINEIIHQSLNEELQQSQRLKGLR